jgi:hypothetical protein
MSDCPHTVLALAPARSPRLRCRHCHLTIAADELGSGSCPECLDAYGIQRRDFEPVADDAGGGVRYCCEACGLIVEC